MRLVPERSPFPRLLVFPFGVLAAIGIAAVLRDAGAVRAAAHCPLLDATGVPCPTCGGTETTIALIQGRWSAALGINPFIAVGLVLFTAWLVWSLAATVRPVLRRTPELNPGEKKAARITAGAVLVAAWVWQIVRLG